MKIILFSLFFCSPVMADREVPNVVLSTSARTVSDIYKPSKNRDPMIPSEVYSSRTGTSTSYNEALISKNVSASTAPFNLSFSILGIVDFYGNKEVLIRDDQGNAFICREGKIYDSKRKPLVGKKCDIKGREIVIKDVSGKSTKLSFEK